MCIYNFNIFIKLKLILNTKNELKMKKKNVDFSPWNRISISRDKKPDRTRRLMKTGTASVSFSYHTCLLSSLRALDFKL